jgi:outer membrane cobalamin receptor
MRKLSTLLVLFFMAQIAFAAVTGSIRGRITAELTATPLAGATISINGQTAQTDEMGIFTIETIEIGTYSMTVTKENFKPTTQNLIVKANEVAQINVALKIIALDLPEVLVQSDRATSAASSLTLNALDFQLRSVNSTQDMLRNVPGLITAQHAGGGKAEQMYLRGFDADHGTDVAASVDGIPVNMPSHGHGQGYLDLHFLLPEVAKNVEITKGTYFADLGDFSTAGAVKFKTIDRVEQNIVQLEVGSVPSQRAFSTSRAFAMLQLPFQNNHVSSYVASEYIFAPSYFDAPQDFKRFNALSKTTFDWGNNHKIAVLLSQFHSSWSASGQVPTRAIEDGTLNRFGAIDNTEGGTTGRKNASVIYTHSFDNQSFEAQGYFSKYDFSLYSNFTFFLNDSINGDQIHQRDERNIMGANVKYAITSERNKFTIGATTRYDNIDNSLDHTVRRTFLDRVATANIQNMNTAIYVKNEFRLSDKLQMEIGLRFNYLNFNVLDKLPSDATHENYSGSNYQTQLAPKLNFIYSLTPKSKFFLNLGRGFHSNDARAVVQDYNNTRLPDAWGGEVGTQLHPAKGVVISAAVWALELANELTFVGDEGTTSDNGASRRIGLDVSARVKLMDGLYADADFNLSNGRLVEKTFGVQLPTDNRIPLAPSITSAGGVTWRRGAIEGSTRYRYVGDRAANEANSVTALGYGLVDVNCFHKTPRHRIGISIENLLNTQWNEAQFDTESRLKGEASAVSELHFTPGTPFAAKLIVGFYF